MRSKLSLNPIYKRTLKCRSHIVQLEVTTVCQHVNLLLFFLLIHNKFSGQQDSREWYQI